MTESVTPELTELEQVARLAAEAALAALPDLAPRLLAVEESLAQILATLATAAGPDGGGARLAARLDAIEQAPTPAPAIDPSLAERLTAVEQALTDLGALPQLAPLVVTLERTNP